ncbi:MAG TPA: CHAT domain-containing protein, partial [Acidimicrobiales bacterium]|nr:CHAT domain-containing protein [Acidimicrobiales bacterium]
MLTSALVLLQLVQRDEQRGPPVEVLAAAAGGLLAGQPPPSEVPLLAAGAALNAGEPKRAVRILDGAALPPGGDEAAVAAAFRKVAAVLDGNWFPGGTGAVLEGGDLAGLAAAVPVATGPDAALVVLVAGECVAMAPTWRSIVAGARRLGTPGAAQAVLPAVEALGRRLAAFGVAPAVAHHALLHADLLWRAGSGPLAVGPLQLAAATYQGAGDLAGMGAALMTQGDWMAEPASHPETLGLDLEAPTATAAPPGRDAPSAGQLYDQAARCFAAAGATRGQAAVELRLGHLAGVAGDHDRARRHLGRAAALAGEAGDGALQHLAAVHDVLAAVEAGDEPRADEVAGAVLAWAGGDGSTSFARGLARLAYARARARREQGDVVGARAALRLAQAVNRGLSSTTEPVLVRDEVAHLYGGANYRRAVLVLSDLELAEAVAHLERAPADAGPADAAAWMRLVDQAMQANGAAVALMDPDAIEASTARLRWLLDRLPAAGPAGGPGSPAADFVAMVRPAVEGTVAQAAVLAPLYRGTAARNRGLLKEAARWFDGALSAARAMGDGGLMLQAVVHGTTRNRAEGLALTDRLVASGFPSDLAVALYLRLGAPEKAAAEQAKLDAAGPPPAGARPWDDLAQRAEIAAGLGRPHDAGPLAARAVELFEHHLARLTRDVLRITATDDSMVAGLYTTGVRVALDQDGGDAGVAASFRLSDRCRGIALADLLAQDEAAGADPATVAAVRGWNRSGAELARTFEELGSWRGGDPAAVRRRIAEAEAAVDDAEAAVARLAPTLFAARRRPPPSPGLDEVQALLPPGTALVQYHAYDDLLVTWAVTAGGARALRARAVTGELSALAARYHRACAESDTGAPERAALGAELAELLLAPVGAELAAGDRVVFVPFGPLTLVPFHLLPHGGGRLGDGHGVSLLPAASTLPRWRPGRVPPRLDHAVVVGDPAYAPGRDLRRLPGSGTEAAVVAARLGVTALTGAAAGGAAVTAALGDATVVHLATHGVLHEDAPASAELALAGHDSLTIPDLLGLDTHIDLAV